MRRVLADTLYWVALIDDRDLNHLRAAAASEALGATPIVTTEPILVEWLNYFAEAGPHWRRRALDTVDMIQQSLLIEVLPYEPWSTLQNALSLYAARPDKG